jgi:hypothetical protein
MKYGLLGAAATVTLGMFVQWLLGLWYLRKYVEVTLPQLARAMWRPVWTTAVMTAVVHGATRLWDNHSLLGLGATLVLAVAVYGLLNRRTLTELRGSRKFGT